MTLVTDEEWGTWTAAEIARRCCVSNDFAARMKRDYESSLSSNESEPPPPRTYTTKHGTTATMNTANIGKRRDDAERVGLPVLSFCDKTVVFGFGKGVVIL